MVGQPTGMTVVVGVDEIPESLAAIQLAGREAEYRGVRLVAVMAYSSSNGSSTNGSYSSSYNNGSNGSAGALAVRPSATSRSAEQQRQTATVTLRDAVMQALGTKADDAELRVVAGMLGRAVVDIARTLNAQLVVLTTRRERTPSRKLGPVSQYMLRSAASPVSHYVLRNAPSPVLVVPDNSKTHLLSRGT
jgi:nucleotide-binding universal stress UspA family protein